METEASHMLEAALVQMDDIIAGSKAAAGEFSHSMYDLGSPAGAGPLQVVQLAEDLKLALERRPDQQERESLRARLRSDTAQALVDWLQSGSVNRCSPANNETYQERLLRLEGDKESLVLQVSVLTDQVEAQGEKIRDLESSLEEHRQKLASTEEMLQQELISRTSLETQKLDLMDEVSYLKLRLVGVEETHSDTTQQRQDAADTNQNKAEVREVCVCVCVCFSELMLLHLNRLSTATSRACHVHYRRHVTLPSDAPEPTRRRVSETLNVPVVFVSLDQEYHRLKVGMESLLASNDEKDRRIEELTALIGQYRKMREVMALTQGSSPACVGRYLEFPPLLPVYSNIIVLLLLLLSLITNQGAVKRTSTKDVVLGSCILLSHNLTTGTISQKDAWTLRRRGSFFLGLYPFFWLHQLPAVICFPSGRPEKPEESLLSDQSPLSSGVDSGQQSPVSPENRKSHRGIKKLWGKIRRSQSGSPVQLHDPELGEFKRGGFRATAGPRLARSGNARDPKAPFSKWSTEQVCDWLEDIGLGQYAVFARHWVTDGQTLLAASVQDLEKEMAVKNPLHRKKLQLAVKAFGSKQPEKSAELDYVWVTRWLDDIGLPQYKDQFNDGRVDGQMLQYLTVNDLLFLKVTSQLHHLSIKCAIHVLHVNKFNANCLKRRPGNENQFSPGEVIQWSNHRVMEWLRSVDLAEYAPNLRGSGVHGGLIMLEPRFGWDTLAMLLNIPPQKSLLRRHLSTNFNGLVGAQARREKREYTEAPGYTPLSITAKVKPKKLGFSNLTHLRRRRSDESTDYVCPIEASPSPGSGQPAVNGAQVRPYAGFRGLSPILDRETDPSRDQVGPDDAAASPDEDGKKRTPNSM
uniref:SAM domain-containing protein n=1 Tax=Scophthalmus maximus TaxID=52904 RepID=A0A8D3CC94_SCOMX